MAVQPFNDAQQCMEIGGLLPGRQRRAAIGREQVEVPSAVALKGEIGVHRNRVGQEREKIIHRLFSRVLDFQP